MQNFSIRLANSVDLASLQDIEIQAAQRFKGLGLIDHLLDQTFCQDKLNELIEQKQVWIACINDKVIGFAIVSILGDNDNTEAYLEEISVLPEFGKQGFGKKLIEVICRWAKIKGLPSILLSTFREVNWNAPFYERIGFKTLSACDWNEEMYKIQKVERMHGYPIDKRVFMRLHLDNTSV